jgi:hypothetical protein
MKRDMDLIRDILLKLEEVPENSYLSNPPEDLDLQEHSFEEVAYHLGLLIDAGLLEASQDLSGGFAVKKITWHGHEFLDDTRDPTIGARRRIVPRGLPTPASDCFGKSPRLKSKRSWGCCEPTRPDRIGRAAGACCCRRGARLDALSRILCGQHPQPAHAASLRAPRMNF